MTVSRNRSPNSLPTVVLQKVPRDKEIQHGYPQAARRRRGASRPPRPRARGIPCSDPSRRVDDAVARKGTGRSRGECRCTKIRPESAPVGFRDAPAINRAKIQTAALRPFHQHGVVEVWRRSAREIGAEEHGREHGSGVSLGSLAHHAILDRLGLAPFSKVMKEADKVLVAGEKAQVLFIVLDHPREACMCLLQRYSAVRVRSERIPVRRSGSAQTRVDNVEQATDALHGPFCLAFEPSVQVDDVQRRFLVVRNVGEDDLDDLTEYGIESSLDHLQPGMRPGRWHSARWADSALIVSDTVPVPVAMMTSLGGATTFLSDIRTSLVGIANLSSPGMAIQRAISYALTGRPMIMGQKLA